MKKNTLRRLAALTLCAVLMTTACSSRAKKPESSAPETAKTSETEESLTFDEFTDKLFKETISTDVLTLHYALKNPDAYGIEDVPLSLGDIETEFDQASHDEMAAEYQQLLSYEDTGLTEDQFLTFDILDKYMSMLLTYDTEELFYYQEPFAGLSGLQTQLPLVLSEYTLRSAQDVEDYLVLLEDVPRYINDALTFEQKKSEAGLFMSDESADEVIKTCREWLDDPDGISLISIFPDKVAGVPGLTQDQITDFTARNETAVRECVVPAYEKVIETFTALKGTGTNPLGIGAFEHGDTYYESLIRMQTGTDMTAEELDDYIEDAIETLYGELFTLIQANPALYDQMDQAPEVPYDSPEDMLNALTTAIEDEFPPAVSKNYTINYVPASMEESMNPAFYMLPPMDDKDQNVIYINKGQIGDDLSLFTTLAHEGYPGHLYQQSWFISHDPVPIRTQLNFLGYVEGWASYVEALANHYVGMEEDLAEAWRINTELTLCLYLQMDLGIHTKDWTEEDLADFLSEYGIGDEETAHEIFRTIVTDPASYLPYGIGELEIRSMRAEAEETLGDAFDPVAFHTFLLDIGPCQFDIIRDYFEDFLKQ